MSRRIEITIPSSWVEVVRETLYSPEQCNLNADSGKPHMIVELHGETNTVFQVTVPGPAVSAILAALRKNGIGISVGRIILSTIDYVKPELSKPLENIVTKKDRESAKPQAGAKPAPLKGFQHFQKARKTTEELYNEISNAANMNINTWLNLFGASIMAAGGLTTNVTVFIVAAMLVSPIMGPILGMTFGYRVADWPLFRTGFYNEIRMALAAYFIGVCFGLVLGNVGNTYKWPNSAMMPEGQSFNLLISIIVSAAAGTVLGVSLTSVGGNALVGTAISAGLLPPIVNAGMLMAYSFTYAPPGEKYAFYEMGIYAILFYFTHVITIVVVANLVFWLKDIDPRFKEGDDSNFDDIPSLVAHRERLLAQGKSGQLDLEKAKAEYFFQNIKDDVTSMAYDFRDKAAGFANVITGGLIGTQNNNQGYSRMQQRFENTTSVNQFGDVEMSSTPNVISPFKQSSKSDENNDTQEHQINDHANVNTSTPTGYSTVNFDEPDTMNPVHANL